MPNTPDRPAAPVDDAELNQRITASHTLSVALRAAGIRSLCDMGRTPQDPAVTVSLLHSRWAPVTVLDGTDMPDQSAATVLRHGLHSLSITSDTSVETFGPETTLRVKLPTCGDALRLAQWFMEFLPPPRAAAQQLRDVLENLGIGAGDIHATGALIHFGGLGVHDAVALGRFLYDIPGPALDPDDGWHAVEYLASRTGAILSAESGHVVMVRADPACSTCSRSPRLQVGDLAVAATLRLTAALETAAESRDPQQT
ncbi:hypothetical protein [Streptomyces sp. NBC_01538]|uniref:hypothetical protein n=1 Tax=Streptomyces sp. NBC_01538 TaxID=2903897 RepID=UPI0038692EDD